MTNEQWDEGKQGRFNEWRTLLKEYADYYGVTVYQLNSIFWFPPANVDNLDPRQWAEQHKFSDRVYDEGPKLVDLVNWKDKYFELRDTHLEYKKIHP